MTDARAVALVKELEEEFDISLWDKSVKMDFADRIAAALADETERCARIAEEYEDACILGEVSHGDKSATRHGRAASKAIAQAIRQAREGA
jgi:hypothetical protein